MVSVDPTVNGPAYGVLLGVGVDPSVVQKIDAPEVASVTVTVCADVYVAGTGLNTGVAVVRV